MSMVKYVLVRHPNKYITLGVNYDVESQEPVDFEIDLRYVLYAVTGLAIITIGVAYGS